MTGWNRTQWVGEGQGLAAPAADDADTWDRRQWVGEGQGPVGPRTVASARADDSRPHGFDGFGVSDSGGQRWAPGIGGSEKVKETPSSAVIAEDEAVA
jgi:hypothetical protein